MCVCVSVPGPEFFVETVVLFYMDISYAKVFFFFFFLFSLFLFETVQECCTWAWNSILGRDFFSFFPFPVCAVCSCCYCRRCNGSVTWDQSGTKTISLPPPLPYQTSFYKTESAILVCFSVSNQNCLVDDRYWIRYTIYNIFWGRGIQDRIRSPLDNVSSLCWAKNKKRKKRKCLTSWRKIERQKRRSIGGGRDPTGPGRLDDRWIDPLYWVAAHDDDDWQPKRKKNGARVRL